MPQIEDVRYQRPADHLIREAAETPEMVRFWSPQTMATIRAIVTARLADDDLNAEPCRRLWAEAAQRQAHVVAAELARGIRPDPQAVDRLIGAIELLGVGEPADAARWVRRLAASKAARKRNP